MLFSMNSLDPQRSPTLAQGGKSSLLAFLLLFAAELIAVFLAGGPRQGGMGIFLTVAGLVLIALPLQRVVSWWLLPLGLLLILAASSSLLPMGFCGTGQFGVSPWREHLGALPALHLSGSVTVDPLATIFWIAMLTASFSIAIYCLTSFLSPRSMEWVALLAVLGCSIYAVVAWIAWQTGWHYPFFVRESWAQPAFGFFVNRNQTAGFLLTGAILSLGLIHRGMNGGSLLAAMISGMACALLVAVLLFFSQSRGGLIFLIVGVVIWIAGLGKYRSRLLLLGSVGLFVIIGMLFLSSGSGLLERFAGSEAPKSSVSGNVSVSLGREARIGIALDTTRMIRDLPITGSGLGTYAEVYPFYADRSLRDKTTALHAESDWLTLSAEAGLPTLLIAFAGIALLSSRIPKLRMMSGQFWPVRWAFLSAFFAEFLHGFVDVPFHKPELGWWLLLLGAVGFSLPSVGVAPSRILLTIQRIFFILAGIGILCLGAWLIRAQWFGGEALPPFALAATQKQFIKTYGEGDDASVKQAGEELAAAIAKYPMMHPLYFQLGMLMANDGSLQQGLDLFAAERALQPNDSIFVFEQGCALIPSSPDVAVELWREALRRQLKMDQLPTSGIQRAPELFGQMIQVAQKNALPSEKMMGLAAMSPPLRMTWLQSPLSNEEMIVAAVQDNDFMHQISPKEQGRLLEIWWQRGDKRAVASFMETHREYAVSGVMTKASILAMSGQPEQACRLLIQTFGIPLPIKAMGSTAIHAAEGNIPTEPLAAAEYYMKQGNVVAARHLLDEASKEGKSTSSQTEILFLRAALEMSADKWTDALQQLVSYLRSSGRI